MAQLDRLLDDDARIQQVTAARAQRAPWTTRRGRAATPVAGGRRRLGVTRLERWRYVARARFGAEGLVVRPSCRGYLQRVPDDTTLRRGANRLTPASVERLEERVVAVARRSIASMAASPPGPGASARTARG